MADDYYRFMERAHVLRGEASKRVYRLGDRVRVQVIKVDLERRQIDLGLTEILDAVRASERNRKPRRSQVQPKNASPRPPRGRAARPGPRDRTFKKSARRKR
jgi:ribonuclease R